MLQLPIIIKKNFVSSNWSDGGNSYGDAAHSFDDCDVTLCTKDRKGRSHTKG